MENFPIRHSCNRCHAQKISCKRIGREPCETCSRLKIECESSPSLRFQRSGGGRNRGKAPAPRQTTTSTVQQRGTTQGEADQTPTQGPAYTLTGAPYHGLNLDTASEQFWQDLNVTLGGNSDVTQTFQALNLGENLSGQENNLFSFGETSKGPTQSSRHALTDSDLMLLNGTTHSLNHNNPPSSPSCTDILSFDCDLDTILQVETDKNATTTNVASIQNGTLNASFLPGNAGYFAAGTANLTSITRHLSLHSGKPQLIPQALANELHNISTHLLEMSHLISIITNNGRSSDSHSTVRHVLVSPYSSTQTGAPLHRGILPNPPSLSLTSGQSFQPFPMDTLFTVSEIFVETLQKASRRINEWSKQQRTAATATNCTDGVDIETFIDIADTTHIGFEHVYNRIIRLVKTILTDKNMKVRPHMRQAFRPDSTPLSCDQGDSQTCLGLFRFPAVFFGRFAVSSTPAMQLELGMLLINELQCRLSKAIVKIHTFLPARQQQKSALHLSSSTLTSRFFPERRLATFAAASVSPFENFDQLPMPNSMELAGIPFVNHGAAREMDFRW